MASDEADGARRSNAGSDALLTALASRIACAWAADVGKGVAVELKAKVKMGRRCLSLRAASSFGSVEGAVNMGVVVVDVENDGNGAAVLRAAEITGSGAAAAGIKAEGFGTEEPFDAAADVLAKAGDSRVLKRSSVRFVGDSPSIDTSFASELTVGGGAKWTTGGGVDAHAGGAIAVALTGAGCLIAGLASTDFLGSASAMTDGRFDAVGDGLAGGPSFERTSCSMRSSAVTAFLRPVAGLETVAVVEAASLLDRFVAATDRRALRRGEGEAMA